MLPKRRLLLCKCVRVVGFKTGIYMAAADDISLSRIVLTNQSRFGVLNAWTGDMDSVSFSTTTANVPAVFNRGNGRLVVLDGYFSGNSTAAALVNEGHFFARNIQSTGYGRALSSTTPITAPTGPTLDEYRGLRAGVHALEFDAAGIAHGAYCVRVETAHGLLTAPVVLVK